MARVLALCSCTLMAVALALALRSTRVAEWRAPSRAAPRTNRTAPATVRDHRSDADVASRPRFPPVEPALARLRYGSGWGESQPAELAAFRDWAILYQAAEPHQRRALVADGVALARVRRPVMRALLASDPRRALALTVPATLLGELPGAIRSELETRVAGRGDYLLFAATPRPGEPPSSLTRRVILGEAQFVAHVYGRRLHQLSKRGASLHGIALDGELALHESPLRALEAEERPGTAGSDSCPVTNLAAIPSGTGFAARAFGRVWEFCSSGVDMLAQFEQRLIQQEDAAGPDVAAPWIAEETHAASAPSRTLGPQRVLVLRVDFADLPGASVSVSDAQSTMDGVVKPFFDSASYGRTTLVTTVAPNVYRLPRTAASYARDGQEWALHQDARAAAAADFAMNTFDRVIVAFNHIGSSRIPGSRINDAGKAIVGAEEVWINGTFAFHPVAHEIGHTYGLVHANLWQVSDRNPVSPAGRSLEYGDPFDLMGTGTDARADLNLPQKHRLGWLPDHAIRTVTTSGTYRVYRFDHRDAAALNQPLALRVNRDGQRSYWIGLRQAFTANASLTNGAYIVWSYDAGPTELLDLSTPGTDSSDAALAAGASFEDTALGIRLKPLARGGSDSARYLDIEVTLPPSPPDGVWAWGGYGTRYIPPGLTGLSAIDANDSIVAAVRANGTLVGWGAHGGGFANLPTTITNAATVAANGGVLKVDGTVELWGPGWPGATSPPPGLTGVRQLAMGYAHTLALKFDGTVVAWGLEEAGERTVPADLKDVIAIAAGRRFSVAVKADGTVVRWGRISTTDVPLPASLRDAIAVAANHASDHFLVLRADGTVLVAGASDLGQGRIPPGLTNVVAIAAGTSHSLALKADGSVVAWGSNSAGQCDVPPNLPRAFAITANSGISYALTGGGAYVTAHPRPQTLAAGSSTTLSVTVSTLATPVYQWRKDGIVIAGATTATLALPNPSLADAGLYDVVVSTPASRITSVPAKLAVVPPLVSRISRNPNPSSKAQTPASRSPRPAAARSVTSGARTACRFRGPRAARWRCPASPLRTPDSTT